MNANAKKWVEALRSGEFKQAQGKLRKKDGYCCLGVACELYRQEVGGEWKEDPDFGFIFKDGEDASDLTLPGGVQDWLDLNSDDGYYLENKVYKGHTLAFRNDEGDSFEQIADIIEEHPGLFGRTKD